MKNDLELVGKKTTETKTETNNDNKAIKRTRTDNTFGKLANLSTAVLTQWQLNNPNFNSSAFSFRDYQQTTTNFQTLMSESANLQNDKKQSVQSLNLVNKQITKAASVLRSYFKINQLVNNINLENEYNRYGFELKIGQKGQRVYAFPTDNDSRKAALQMIVAEMQQPNNFYAAKDLGLAYWLDLQTAHSTAWNDSNNYRARVSINSRDKKIVFEQLKNMLTMLKGNIKAHYYRQNSAQILRSFGFLKENF